MDTPLMRQYYEIKRRYPDAILFFRVGDFYETFEDDAKLVSRELNIVLTSRSTDRSGRRIPLAGIPHHALEAYLARLVKKGYKVAICEQLEDPKKAKGIVKRGVVRVVTPGTVIEDGILGDRASNYIASVAVGDDGACVAVMDVSTGEFIVEKCAPEDVEGVMMRYSPAEVLVPEGYDENFTAYVTALNNRYYEEAERALCEHFSVPTPRSVGLTEDAEILAAGSLLLYVKENLMAPLQHVREITVSSKRDAMVLDSTTLKNLEILRNLRGEEEGTLISLLDRCATKMGSRTVRAWLRAPSTNVLVINKRLDAVEELKNDILLRSPLISSLRGFPDLERLVAKVSYGRAKPKDLLQIKEALRRVSHIRELLGEVKSALLKEVRDGLAPIGDLADLLERAVGEGEVGEGAIKDGFSEELDALREALRHGKEWLASLEREERERTGIPNLRIGYNDVMGYYIEVRKTHLSKVPDRYVRKQTLKGVERYTTPELQRIEYRIKDAEARIREVEEAIYREVLREVEGKRAALQENARLIGLLDAVTTLAEVAALRGYVRPAVDEGDEIMIEDGRHPVLDGSDFVPNDVYLNTRDHRLIILTGPNMAGKSTYLRQIAHIVIMAQMGSFVPASRARIGIVDRIYTRVGASDDIIRGRSTFMVEMIEVANIINSATPRSLILLDEVGRGTSTFDGLSIAWAVSEYIHDHIRARTVFATHYHQLIELERFLEGAKNYHMAVAQDGEKLIFLRKVRRGGMSESYGIEVARMAGLPRTVVERAKEVLEKIERENALVVRRGGVRAVQTVLFGEVTREHPAVLKLREIDPLRVTPLQALELLFELRKIAEE